MANKHVKRAQHHSLLEKCKLKLQWDITPPQSECCQVTSVMSDSVQPHRRQPTRLPRPWDSPGKNTGVGCHFLLQWMKVKSESKVTQSRLTLHDPMDCSLPGSSVHGIFQARVLEWGATAFSVFVSESSYLPPSQFSFQVVSQFSSNKTLFLYWGKKKDIRRKILARKWKL